MIDRPRIVAQGTLARVARIVHTATNSVIDLPLLAARRSWPNRPLELVTGLLIGLLVIYLRLSTRQPLSGVLLDCPPEEGQDSLLH